MAENKRKIWQIEDYDEITRRKIKAHAVTNGYSIAQALTQIVTEWEALKAQYDAHEKSKENAHAQSS